MKSTRLRIAIVLLLGAVVNVAVAWGCAGCTPIGSWRTVPIGDALPLEVQSLIPVGWNSSDTNQITLIFKSQSNPEAIGVRLTHLGVFEGRGGFGAGFGRELLIIRSGWPAVSMACEGLISNLPTQTAPAQPEWQYGLSASYLPRVQSPQTGFWPATIARALPLRPTWPGFVLNTLFYAVIVWPLICGPFALRRFVRTRRGLCPACAYPMGNSSVCTECGKVLPPTREGRDVRRHVVLAAAYLLVGAGANLAVAWGCSLWDGGKEQVWAGYMRGVGFDCTYRLHQPGRFDRPRPLRLSRWMAGAVCFRTRRSGDK
jgi:hypothetical protein